MNGDLVYQEDEELKREFPLDPRTEMYVRRAIDEVVRHEGLGMNEYQRRAEVTAVYPQDMRVIYPAMGLAGETGEVAEKVKKWIRDSNREITPEFLLLVKKEMGDVLWYLAALATDLGLTLDEIARHNIEKLADRKERNAIHGSGDER